ncbi:MAG: hypothetical protein EBS05_24085 [Proteobacteria bacterium]|nr:hypothetical protein [Pseudomonadota bacterium]
MTDDDFNPTLPASAAPLAELEKRLLGLLQSIRLVRGQGYNLRPGNRGTALEILPADLPAKVRPQQLFLRTIGIDCYWISQPNPTAPDFNNYWYAADRDLSTHAFCLKPEQLMNARWFDEDTGAMRDNPAYTLAVGDPDPVVDGETYFLESGSYMGITQRTFDLGSGLHETQFIVPQLWTSGWDVGATSYAGTAQVWGLPIPAGLFVCNERGKLIWDWTSSDPYPSDVLNAVETWAIDDPAGPVSLFSTPKAGKYAVTFLDLNVDARHWDHRQLTNEQELSALTVLNTAGLADGTAYNLSIIAGVPTWTAI